MIADSLFQQPDLAIADGQGDDPDDPERAIDKPPVQRYSPHSPGDECQRQDPYTGQHPDREHPFIFYWMTKRPNKEKRNDQMRKSQPVIAIGQKRITAITILQGPVNFIYPAIQTGQCASRPNAEQPMQFRFQCKSRQAAEYQRKDK